jgi:hypothetical protein
MLHVLLMYVDWLAGVAGGAAVVVVYMRTDYIVGVDRRVGIGRARIHGRSGSPHVEDVGGDQVVALYIPTDELHITTSL